MALKRPSWWDRRAGVALLALPLSLLFFLVSSIRRRLYRAGLLRSVTLPVPVIVVGNLAAGGSGKTPVVIWLTQALHARGFHPGIVSRGYGGSASGPQRVSADSDPGLVGDEPVLLARRTGFPLWVGRDRVAAAQALLHGSPEVDVIVTDDGLQHYRLGRRAEVVVLNERILGNAWLMPSGPLREPLERLAGVDLIVANGVLSPALEARLPRPAVSMTLAPGGFYRLDDPQQRCEASHFPTGRVHALAGIADPERFFASLRSMGLRLASCRAFGDHENFRREDLSVPEGDVLLITEKDAVKCAALAPADCWVLPVDAQIDDAALAPILERLHGSEAA